MEYALGPPHLKEVLAVLGGRRLVAVVTGLAMTLLTGCGAAPDQFDADVGTAKNCPHRNAYCPATGPGVSLPGRPSLSPSGRFRLEVLGADPVTADEDWRFHIVDAHTGAVVLAPARPAFDGGLGLVFAWGEDTPDTAWAGRRVNLSRWRPGPDGTGQWTNERPGPDEKLPALVIATFASDTG